MSFPFPGVSTGGGGFSLSQSPNVSPTITSYNTLSGSPLREKSLAEIAQPVLLGALALLAVVAWKKL